MKFMKKLFLLSVISLFTQIIYAQCDDVFLNPEYEVCEGGGISLVVVNDPSYTYQWFYEGEVIPDATNSSLLVLTTGAYSVEVTKDVNTVCSASTTVIYQEVITDLESTFPSADAEGVIRVCVGEEVTFTCVEQPNTFYFWDIAFNETLQGTTVSYIFDTSGVYNITLNAVNLSGCVQSNDSLVQVLVASAPSVTFFDNNIQAVCLGDTITVTAQADASNISACDLSLDEESLIPDDNGISNINFCLDVNCFDENATLQSVNDLLSVCLNIEHSFLGDLDMTLIAPDGTEVILKSFASGGGGNFLGVPVEPDGDLSPGVGFDYCFNQNAATTLINGTIVEVSSGPPSNTMGNAIEAGDYLPEESFENLIGVPLNGTWCLRIVDNLASDNGYLFGFDLNFDPSLFVDTSIINNITTQGWQPSANATIVNDTVIEITPDAEGTFCYTYIIEDSFGCIYTEQYCIDVVDTSIVPPVNLIIEEPNSDSVAIFDLTQNTPIVLGTNDSFNYTVLYYETLLDAESNTNPISESVNSNYVNLSNPQTIFVRVFNNLINCGSDIESFELVVIDLGPSNDTDKDGVVDIEEDVNNNGDLEDDDTDGDGTPNYQDTDDDGDSVPTATEIEGIGAGFGPINGIDTDTDMIENYLDDDDDGDGVLSINEDYNNNGTPLDDDINGNGIPDFLDSEVTLGINHHIFDTLNVFPNPAIDTITIKFSEVIDSMIVSVVSINGQILLQKPVKASSVATINIHTLQSGVYFLQTISAEGKNVQKFIKK